MTAHGFNSEYIPAADALALSLIALLLFCLVCFAIGAWVLWRREKRCAVVSTEIRGTTQINYNSAPAKNRKSWERDEDWWKK